MSRALCHTGMVVAVTSTPVYPASASPNTIPATFHAILSGLGRPPAHFIRRTTGAQRRRPRSTSTHTNAGAENSPKI